MRTTKRTLNKCNSCGDTWYPRGRTVSNKCPRCGSTDVRLSYGGLLGGIIALVVIGAIVSKSGDAPKTDTPTAAIGAPAEPSKAPVTAERKVQAEAGLAVTLASPDPPAPSDGVSAAAPIANATVATTRKCRFQSGRKTILIDKGTDVSVLRAKGRLTEVTLANGQKGWVDRKCLK